MSTKISQGLRADVVTAVQVEVRRTGLKGFKASAITGVFKGTIERATLARWIRDAVAAEDSRRQQGASSVSTGTAIGETSSGTPVWRPELERIALRPRSITRRIDELIDVAEDCVREARGDYGGPRNPKLMLSALEQGRRCVHTAALLTEKLHTIERIDQFYASVIEEIEKTSPACAKQILSNVERILNDFGFR